MDCVYYIIHGYCICINECSWFNRADDDNVTFTNEIVKMDNVSYTNANA